MPQEPRNGKIPPDELDRLKKGVDLVSLIQSYGVPLSKHGSKDLIGHCPFHEDKTPSLIVTPEKGLWHCMGACGEGGDVITWLQKAQKVSFRQAVAFLREGDFSLLTVPKGASKHALQKRLPCPVQEGMSDGEALRAVIDFYHESLKKDHRPTDYLKERGLNSEDVIETFKLGYADRGLGNRLPPKQNPSGKKIREQLQRIGVLSDKGHEVFRGSIVIPVIDKSGEVTEVYGRKVNQNLRAGTSYHNYLKGPHRGIFNPACLESPHVILCESFIDALSFWVHGHKNVTASFGTNGFTEEMLASFIKHGVKQVTIAYDRDTAGDKAADKLAKVLIGEVMACSRLLLPQGMDVNEYIQRHDPQSLKILLDTAEPYSIGVKVAQQPLEESPSSEPTAAVAFEKKGDDYHFAFGDRRYRVQGLHKNTGTLRIHLLLKVGVSAYHDTVDLYQRKSRETFIKYGSEDAGVKEEVIKRDLSRLWERLEEIRDEYIESMTKKKEKAYEMNSKERMAALSFLKSPDLLDKIKEHLFFCGYIGEEVNKLVGYLAATSRKMEEPLSVIIQGSSGVGKTELMKSALKFMPTEDVVAYSFMTGQSLYYMETDRLKNKILSIAEEEGAGKASYPLKLLISEKTLHIASAGKDEETGRHTTVECDTEGPTSVFSTTTSFDIDEELMNRCLVLHVDESREQKEKVLSHQRFLKTPEGRRYKRRAEETHRLHQNAQRLLKPLEVRNPYCERLTFSSLGPYALRHQMKYLNLIETIAFLHQHQRPVKKDESGIEYIEVEPVDIALANALSNEVFGQSLSELPPQTRYLLKQIHDQVKKVMTEHEVEQNTVLLTRREIREYTGFGDTQLKVHLHRLVEMEYLLVHRGGHGSQYVYELLYRGEGKEEEMFCMGLIDVKKLYEYDDELSGVNGKSAGVSRALVGPQSGGGRVPLNGIEVNNDGDLTGSSPESPESIYIELKKLLLIVILVPHLSPSFLGMLIALLQHHLSPQLVADGRNP